MENWLHTNYLLVIFTQDYSGCHYNAAALPAVQASGWTVNGRVAATDRSEIFSQARKNTEQEVRDIREQSYPGKAGKHRKGLLFWQPLLVEEASPPQASHAPGMLAGGWGCPPPPRWSLSVLPLPERLSLPWGLLVGLDPKSTQFMERFLLRSTALVRVTAQRHSWISGVQSGVLSHQQMSREVGGLVTGTAMPVKGQSFLNLFFTFPLLHFTDF